jgi:hypothetical protein
MRLVLLFLLIYCTQAGTFAADPVPVKDAVAAAFESRKQIKTFHLVITVQSSDMNTGKKEDETRERRRFEVWSDGKRSRLDWTILEHNREPKQVNRRHITCRHCEREGYAAYTVRGKGFIHTVDFRKITPEFEAADSMNLDWAHLGFMSGYTRSLTARDEFSVLLKPEATVSASRLVENGETVFRYESVLQNPNCLRRIDLLPEKGYNPSTVAVICDKENYRQVMNAEYALDPHSQLWFPKKIRYTKTASENFIFSDNQLTFETVELNVPIPEVTFTLAGFDLVDNTAIQFPEVKKLEEAPTWQKGKADPKRPLGDVVRETYEKMNQTGARAPVPDNPPSWFSRSWPYLVAGGLTILAVFLFRSSRRRSASE